MYILYNIYRPQTFDAHIIVYIGRLQTIVYTYIYNIIHYRTFEQHTTYGFIPNTAVSVLPNL